MKTSLIRIAAVSLLALVAGARIASADSLSITYFSIGETDKDANHLASGVFSNEVQNHLGPNGLPILNTTTYGCLSNCYAIPGAPTDVTAGGEITYWSPSLNTGGAGGTSDVVATLTTSTSIPFSDDTLFAPNGTGSGDGSAFQAVHLFGTINAPTTENISFSLSSDDMAFVYIDGSLVCSDGGVHGNSAGTCTTLNAVSQGNHQFDLFFVDINNVASALDFSITTQGVTTTSTVPEPSTLMLLGTGLVGAAGAIRRRISR